MILNVKLFVQIPCYNEANQLPAVLEAVPRDVPGFDTVDIVVIDDGSSDNTAAAAAACGVKQIVRLARHAGLAAAFSAGLETCLSLGADVIVNLDGDGQYDPRDIPRLTAPLLAGQAEIAVGDRGVARLTGFSPFKRHLQIIGSLFVSQAAGFKIPDAASGFRAFTRPAALGALVLNDYTYTLETLIQAGAEQRGVAFVPVQTRPVERPSRLARGNLDYIRQAAPTLLRAYTLYRPLTIFLWTGGILLFGGIVLAARYLYYYFQGQGSGHVQSVILAAVLLIVGGQTCLIGMLADLIRANRRILEKILQRLDSDL